MEMTAAVPIQQRETKSLWRIWIDNTRQIVSFHEEEGCRLLEFRSRELFWNCVEQYRTQHYRYQ